MADRNLVKYIEPKPSSDSIEFRLQIDRLASGAPGLMVSVQAETGDSRAVQELSVMVTDGEALLAPVNEWLEANSKKPSSKVVALTPDQAGVLLQARYAELTRQRNKHKPHMTRDEIRRDEMIAEATRLGVPEKQANDFVFAPVSETTEEEE